MLSTFKITNRHGKNIVGDVHVASPAKGLVFMQHGLSGCRQQQYLVSLCAELQKRQFTVCTFDTTNSFGESDGELKQATLTQHHNDLVDVIDWSKKQPWYAMKFFLVGHGIGGTSVLLYAAHYPEEVTAIAPLAIVTSGKDYVHTQAKHSPIEWDQWRRDGYKTEISRLNGKKGLVSLAFVNDLQRYDLMALSSRLTIPMFMRVGSKDISTPPEYQERFFQSLPAKIRAESTYSVIDGAEHTFEKPDQISLLCTQLGDWLEKLAGSVKKS